MRLHARARRNARNSTRFSQTFLSTGVRHVGPTPSSDVDIADVQLLHKMAVLQKRRFFDGFFLFYEFSFSFFLFAVYDLQFPCGSCRATRERRRRHDRNGKPRSFRLKGLDNSGKTNAQYRFILVIPKVRIYCTTKLRSSDGHSYEGKRIVLPLYAGRMRFSDTAMRSCRNSASQSPCCPACTDSNTGGAIAALHQSPARSECQHRKVLSVEDNDISTFRSMPPKAYPKIGTIKCM